MPTVSSTSRPFRWLAIITCVTLLAALTACAGEGSEVADLRAQLEAQEVEAASTEERLETLETELGELRDGLAAAAGRDQLELLGDELATTTAALEELNARLDDVASELEDALGAVDELLSTDAEAAAAREELAGRIEAVGRDLETVAAELRSAVRGVEGQTAGIADQLDALRERVDVLQRRTQQAGAR